MITSSEKNIPNPSLWMWVCCHCFYHNTKGLQDGSSKIKSNQTKQTKKSPQRVFLSKWMPSMHQENIGSKSLPPLEQTWGAHCPPPAACEQGHLRASAKDSGSLHPCSHPCSWSPASAVSVPVASKGAGSSRNRQVVKQRPQSSAKIHIQDICSSNVLLAFHMTHQLVFQIQLSPLICFSFLALFPCKSL